MASQFLDLVAYDITQTGTGDIDFDNGTATFFTLAEAGATDGATLYYRIRQGSDVEVGSGVYTTATNVLTRTVIRSKVSGTAGTTKITLDGTAQISIVLPADQITKLSLSNLDSVAINAPLTFAGGSSVSDSSGNITITAPGAGDIITLAGNNVTNNAVVQIGGTSLGDGILRIKDNAGSTRFTISADTDSISGDTAASSISSFASVSAGTLSATTTVTADELRLRETSGAGGQTLSIFASETLTANRTLNFEVGDADKTVTFGATGTYQPGGVTNISSGSFAAANTQVFSSAIPATYSYLVLTFDGLSFDTSTRRPLFQFSVDAGSSWDTTAGNYPGFNVTGATLAANSDASIGHSVNVTSAQSFSGCLTISNYHGGTRPHIDGFMISNGVVYTVDSNYIGSTLNIDGLRMIMNSTGNSDAGTWSLDGVA